MIDLKGSFKIVLMDTDDVFAANCPYTVEAVRLFVKIDKCSKIYRAANHIPDKDYKELTEEDVVVILKRQWQFFFAETDDGKVIGMCTVHKDVSADTYCLCNLIVDEEYRGNGVGKSLAEAAIEWCGDNYVSLSVSLMNGAAHAMYKKMGFRPTEVIMFKDPPKK